MQTLDEMAEAAVAADRAGNREHYLDLIEEMVISYNAERTCKALTQAEEDADWLANEVGN